MDTLKEGIDGYRDWLGRIVPFGWKPLAEIPNQAGLLITVITKTGQVIKTKVRRSNKTGFHTVINCRMADAVAWQPRIKVCHS
jgi:hypothetical protein